MADKSEEIAKRLRKAENNRWKVLIAAFGFLAILSLGYAITAGLILSVFVLAFIINYLEMWVFGLELMTLTTVLAGASFGPAAGSVIGLMTVLGHIISGQYMGTFVLWLIPSYIAAGFLAGMISMPITQLGITILIGLHIVFSIATVIFNAEELPEYLLYGAINVALNVFLFSSVAPTLFRLMGGAGLL